jgi:hypothetical protein
VPKLASAPGGFDVTCTGVPDAPRTLKLGMLKLGKLKLGMLGSAPQPERAAQLSTEAIARRIIIAPKTRCAGSPTKQGICGFNLAAGAS